MRDSYYPGDIGFDPLRLAPADASGFATMATRELQHGRLAMIAFMGLVAQEYQTHETGAASATKRSRRRSIPARKERAFIFFGRLPAAPGPWPRLASARVANPGFILLRARGLF